MEWRRGVEFAELTHQWAIAQFEILRLAHIVLASGERLVLTFKAHGDTLWAHSSLVFSELRLDLEIEISVVQQQVLDIR